MEDMDYINLEDDEKHVYKLNLKVFDKLNICTSTGNVILWNKYQILLYEKADFHRDPTVFLPEFCLSLVILHENHILCLDCDGNVHVRSLKLKNTQNNNTIIYKPISRSIVAISKLNMNTLLHIQNRDGKFSLNIFKIPKFDSYRQIVCNLAHNTQNIKSEMKAIVKCYPIYYLNTEALSCIFKENKENSKDCYFILMSFDEQNICACIFDLNSQDESLDAVHLYSCPSSISGIDLVQPNDIMISLRSGSLIKLTLSSSILSKVIHVNAPIHKMLVDKTSIYYSDCLSMWKIDTKFTETDFNFKQIMVKHVKDFVKVNNKIVCSTFSNLIYTFSCDREDLYVVNKTDKEYLPIHKVVSYTEDLIDKISFETKKNDEIAHKNHLEVNYTAAVALANRPDIMDNLLTHTIVIYENYEDVISENKNIFLTNELSDYFDKKCNLVLIKLQLSIEYKHNLKDILVILMEDLKLHIKITTQNATLKTTSVSLHNILDRGDFLIPIKSEYLTQIAIGIKLVCPIPGAMFKSQMIWTVLSEKSINLTSEHFIKTHHAENNVTNLKELKENFSNTITTTAEHYHGLLFNFKNVENKYVFDEHSHHIVLPDNYETRLQNKEQYKLSNKTSEFLSSKLSHNDFLKFGHIIQLSIHNNKIRLQIVKKNNNPLLRISGEHGVIVYHMRNYFAKLLSDGSKLVGYAQYTNLGDLRRRLVIHLNTGKISENTILYIRDQLDTIFSTL